MKWTDRIENKMKAAVVLLILCGVVLFSNYRLKRLSNSVAMSVQTIYEDRLLVQDLIFSYDQILDRLNQLNERPPTPTPDQSMLHKAKELEEKYLVTVMTEEEAGIFNSFSSNLSEALISTDVTNQDRINAMRAQLQRLEKIQMEEADRQMVIIRKARGKQQLGFYLETAILVILLVIVQVLVVSNTKLKKILGKDNINYN